MLNIISNIPSQFKIGYYAGKNIKLPKSEIKHVVFCGMGGSALAGDIMKMWLENNKKTERQIDREINLVEILIHKDYDLPKIIDKKNTLVICVSYSGNTEETISSYSAAKNKKMPVIAITNEGGNLLKLCRKNKTPIAEINVKNLPPRLALASQFAAIGGILENLGLINFGKEIGKISKLKISDDKKKSAKEMATSLKGKIPTIYSSKKIKALAYNLKINLNETSKSPAFYNIFPEINHNEIVGFDKSSKINKKIFSVIFIKSKSDHPKVARGIKILKTILAQINFYEINLANDKKISNIFEVIIFSNLISYYLAEIYKINPIKTEIIEKLKIEMAK